MKRLKTEVNSGSMADIAFLLLIFFLVATTIDQDKGLRRKLPAIQENTYEYITHANNVFKLFLNANNELLVNDKRLPISDLQENLRGFIDNNGRKPEWSDRPELAVISLKPSVGTSYDFYIKVQDEIAAAYHFLRDQSAQRIYNKSFNELERESEIKSIKAMYPMNISESNPDE